MVLAFFSAACATSAFLEYIVESRAGHLAVFGVGSYIVFSRYFACNYFLTRLSTSYARIPDDKKFYVLSNLIKAAVLLSYCPLCAVTLFHALAKDEWGTQRIRLLGVLYAIPDCVSLLLVSRMAITTKVHHAAVVLFMCVDLVSDYALEGVHRALVVYALFSTFAYRAPRTFVCRCARVPVFCSHRPRVRVRAAQL